MIVKVLTCKKWRHDFKLNGEVFPRKWRSKGIDGVRGYAIYLYFQSWHMKYTKLLYTNKFSFLDTVDLRWYMIFIKFIVCFLYPLVGYKSPIIGNHERSYMYLITKLKCLQIVNTTVIDFCHNENYKYDLHHWCQN